MENVILKALLRVEKKLDEILRRQDNDKAPRQMLHYGGQSCPLCHAAVRYKPVLRPGGETIVRECGCEPFATELPEGEVR